MMDKMNPEAKKLWLEALRSGEYKQGKTSLRTEDDCFCCLGVLCDIYQKHVAEPQHLPFKWEIGGDRFTYPDWLDTNSIPDSEEIEGYHFNSATASVPNIVEKWSGVAGLGDLGFTSLAHMNDTGSSFAEIADTIEAHL